MKKIISISVCFIMIMALVSCSVLNDAQAGKKSIVCTAYPQYDWTLRILGDRAEDWNVSLLLDNGADLHNFQPSAEDIITINTSDLFIYVGGTSDCWVEDVFKTGSTETRLVNLMQVIDDRLLESGHTHEHGHDHEKEAGHSENCDHEHDEHVWLSLENAEAICDVITDFVCYTDPDNEDDYRSNCEAYTEKLKHLNEGFKDTVESASFNTLVFADRFPFAYLCEDLDITVRTAFSGCSAESEASFETIVELSQEIDALGLTTVMVIDGSDRKLAETVISNTETKDQVIAELDSMQSVTIKDIEAGVSYLSVMEKNLEALKAALN